MRFLHLILLPFSGSRNSSIGNFIRKIHKMGTLPASERETILQLMKPEYENPAHSLLINPSYQNNVNPFFEKSPPYSLLTDEDFADLMYVLKDDMLVKTDRYSMMNSIEIRNPFLDYRVVSFALGLDKKEKISFLKRKKFLYETFQDFLPEHVLKKSKKGFEVPLSEWLFRLLTPLKIQNIFDEEKIRHQGIFNYPNLRSFLKQSITATTVKNPSLVWALWVFQDWYDRNESWIIKKSE
jgi:asparagine synthase (glutamine-hydrolysing)